MLLGCRPLGADACLTLLAGGRPESDISTDVALAAAGFFLVLHFFVWLVTPALVIGAGLFWGAARLAGRRHPPVLSAPPEEEESVS